MHTINKSLKKPEEDSIIFLPFFEIYLQIVIAILLFCSTFISQKFSAFYLPLARLFLGT